MLASEASNKKITKSRDHQHYGFLSNFDVFQLGANTLVAQ